MVERKDKLKNYLKETVSTVDRPADGSSRLSRYKLQKFYKVYQSKKIQFSLTLLQSISVFLFPHLLTKEKY